MHKVELGFSRSVVVAYDEWLDRACDGHCCLKARLEYRVSHTLAVTMQNRLLGVSAFPLNKGPLVCAFQLEFNRRLRKFNTIR